MFSFRFILNKPATSALNQALVDTVRMKGKDPVATVNKAGQYIASFAAAGGARAKIKSADPGKIESTLRRVIHQPTARTHTRRGGKKRKINRTAIVQNEYRGTLAAVIVSSIMAGTQSAKIGRRYVKMVKNLTKGKGGKEATAAQFYRAVAKFVKMKVGSAGYHRSGLGPAVKAFRAARNGVSGLKRLKFPPGAAKPATTGSGVIVASMEDTARVIEDLAPRVFRDAEREVAKQFVKWLQEDMAATARTQGLRTA